MDQVEKELEEMVAKEEAAADYRKPQVIVKSFMGKSAVESSMKRVEKHLNSEQGFFIISTHLGGMTEEEELKRARLLVQELKDRCLGYIPLRGKYTREDNGEIEYEHSFFVPNPGIGNFKAIAQEVCKAQGQESVVFAENGIAGFLHQDGSVTCPMSCLGEVTELNEYWSKLQKGRDRRRFWAFESLYPISNFGLNEAHVMGELF